MSEAGKGVSIGEFQRLVLRVGVVTAAEDHPNADRLLVLTLISPERSIRTGSTVK